MLGWAFFGVIFSVFGKFLCYLDSGSNVTTQCLIREQFSPNTSPARDPGASALIVETELQSGRFTCELRLFNV